MAHHAITENLRMELKTLKIYDSNWDDAIAAFNEEIQNGEMMYGEAPYNDESLEVSMRNASHTVQSLRRDDEGYLIADVTILKTTKGKLVTEALDLYMDIVPKPRAVSVRGGKIIQIFAVDLDFGLKTYPGWRW
jgi:hypothetical protein